MKSGKNRRNNIKLLNRVSEVDRTRSTANRMRLRPESVNT